MTTAAAFVTGISFLVAPAVSSIPLGPNALQLLTTVASLEAQEASIQNNESLACAALFASPTVKVGQPVALAWGSVGAVLSASSSQPTWTPEGATYLTLAQPGTWTYSFTFYGQNGKTVLCTANITAE